MKSFRHLLGKWGASPHYPNDFRYLAVGTAPALRVYIDGKQGGAREAPQVSRDSEASAPRALGSVTIE